MTNPHSGSLADLPRAKDGFRLRGLEMTRLETFTDAAFAFALTLLVISFEPVWRMSDLVVVLKDTPAFLASGSLLMVFWWGHHEWSRRYGLDDGATVLLSALLVFTVLVYVIPLRVMAGTFFLWISQWSGLPLSSGRFFVEGPQDINAIFALYGFGFLAMSWALALLNLYAWRRREELKLNEAEEHDTLTQAGVWALLGGSGGASALMALLAPISWAGSAGWVYMVLPVIMPAYGIARERKRPAMTD